jgi:hypothetical protein
LIYCAGLTAEKGDGEEAEVEDAAVTENRLPEAEAAEKTILLELFTPSALGVVTLPRPPPDMESPVGSEPGIAVVGISPVMLTNA